jgi:hypothetical protein
MSAAAVALVNAAISRTGGNLITGTDFGTGVSTDGLEKNIAYLNYEQLVKAELIDSPYRFARKTAACTLVVDGGGVAVPPTDTDWKFSWTLPADVIKLRTVIRHGVTIDYEIDTSGVILTDYDDLVYAIYTYRADESLWPADFAEGVTRRFEAVLLRNDSHVQEADDRDAAADRKIAQASLAHAQEERPSDPRVFPLIAVRRTGYGSCRR